MPKLLLAPAYVLSIDQQWVMFSPAPRKLGGWYVVDGHTVGGARVFPVPEAGPTDFDTDHWPSDVYATHRWRLYMCQWGAGVTPRGARHLLEYACRRDPRLAEARLHELASVGELDGSRRLPRQREVATLICPR
jgi:hypothetical protein